MGLHGSAGIGMAALLHRIDSADRVPPRQDSTAPWVAWAPTTLRAPGGAPRAGAAREQRASR